MASVGTHPCPPTPWPGRGSWSSGVGAFWAIGPALMGGGQLSGPPLGQEKEAQRIPWWERHQAGLSPSFLGTEEEGGHSEEAAPSQAWKVG